jgi:hypothetical protein
VQVYLSNGVGFPNKTADSEVGGWADSTMPYLADVSGDGRAELLREWQCGTDACLQVNTWDGFAYRSGDSDHVGDWNPAAFRDHVADVDGDAKADFVRLWKDADPPDGLTQRVQVNKSNGSGFPTFHCDDGVGGYDATTMNHLADVNGDGRTDIIRVWDPGSDATGDAFAQVLLAKPTGCFGLDNNPFNGPIGKWDPETKDSFVEVNGDGRADLVRLYPNNGNQYASIRLSTGVGYPTENSNAVQLGPGDPRRAPGRPQR